MSETISVHNMFSPGFSLAFSCIENGNSINNLLSYCGLVDEKIRASDKDLPAPSFTQILTFDLMGISKAQKSKMNKLDQPKL